MVSDMELSAENMERYLSKRLMNRFSLINWGVTCDSLKEALGEIPDEWFSDGIDPLYHNIFREYMISIGAKAKYFVVCRETHITWSFPYDNTSTLPVTIKKVIAEYVNSFFLAERNWKELVEREMISFLRERYRAVGYWDFQNRLYKKILLKTVDERNNHIAKVNEHAAKGYNRWREEPLSYMETIRGMRLYIAKNGESIVPLSQDLFDTKNVNHQIYICIMYFFSELIYKYENMICKPYRMFSYLIPFYCADEVVKALNQRGIQASYMPKYPVEKYIKLVRPINGDGVQVYLHVKCPKFEPIVHDGIVDLNDSKILDRFIRLYVS